MKIHCLEGEAQVDLVWPDESYKILILSENTSFDEVEPDANVIVKNLTPRAVIEFSDDEV
jgi:hypothetical protein